MIFRDIELDFDIFDADNADLFEKAAKDMYSAVGQKDGEGLGDTIRRQCGAVFSFFDTLFGEGFHRELFGEETNLMECIEAFREFVNTVNEQKAALDKIASDIKVDTAAVSAPNRAARRAALKAAGKGLDRE